MENAIKPFEWEKVIDSVAKALFNGDWKKVTNLNIYSFSHKCAYLLHLDKLDKAKK